LAAILLAALSAHAAPTPPALRCQVAKLLAAGMAARARFLCEARSLETGATESCLSRADAVLLEAFQRAELAGGCVTSGDGPDVRKQLFFLAQNVLEALRPSGPAASRCTERQLEAAACTVQKVVRAEARNHRSPDPARLAADEAAAARSLDAAFTRAFTAGDCLSSVISGDVFTLLEHEAEVLVGLLFPVCGDDVQAPGEACDGRASLNCPAGCAADCTCQPIRCPCYTSASIDAAFPSGYFDANGRGGAVCNDTSTVVAINTVDSCFLPGPLLEGMTLSRAGAGAIIGGAPFCVLFSELDPDHDGLCNGPPMVIDHPTADQATACVNELKAPQAWQSESASPP